MSAVPGFPLGTLYRITNISQGFPGVVTLDSLAEPYSFAVSTGQTVTVSKVRGMHQINDKRFIVSALDAETQTFQLYDLNYLPVDTTNYSPYISDGEINIVSYPATAGNPPGLMYNNQ